MLVDIYRQVSQLARATVVTSRLARRESRRGQAKAVRRWTTLWNRIPDFLGVTVHLSRLILAEVESQERSYVEAMQTLVQDYLLPLEQAHPSIVSYQMVIFILLWLFCHSQPANWILFCQTSCCLFFLFLSLNSTFYLFSPIRMPLCYNNHWGSLQSHCQTETIPCTIIVAAHSHTLTSLLPLGNDRNIITSIRASW